MEAADVVLRFLESVGRRSEAEYYLGLFRSDPKEQFAAISVDANVARHAAEAVVLDLRFLSELGLTPVVVLGLLGTQESQEHASRIFRRLQAAGIESALLNAASKTLHDEARAAAQAGIIPLVVFGPARQSSVDRRFAQLGELLAALRTRKLIFIHRPGGLRQKQVLLPLVNLSADYEELMASPELSRKEKLLLAQSRRLVFNLVSHKLNIAITSPLNLFRELFTVKGAGTLLRKGARILSFSALDEVDLPRLRELLSSAFGRAPFPDFFERPLARLYIEDGYRGAALVAQTEFGGFLTKFAVTRQAQGEGMARDLWEQMHTDFPQLFWRARPANPITEWYTKLCDGLARFSEWHVYWTGIGPEKISAAIGFALSQPVDLPPLLPEAVSPRVVPEEEGELSEGRGKAAKKVSVKKSPRGAVKAVSKGAGSKTSASKTSRSKVPSSKTASSKTSSSKTSSSKTASSKTPSSKTPNPKTSNSKASNSNTSNSKTSNSKTSNSKTSTKKSSAPKDASRAAKALLQSSPKKVPKRTEKASGKSSGVSLGKNSAKTSAEGLAKDSVESSADSSSGSTSKGVEVGAPTPGRKKRVSSALNKKMAPGPGVR